MGDSSTSWSELKKKVADFCTKNNYDDALILYYFSESPITEVSVDHLYDYIKDYFLKKLKSDESGGYKRLKKLAVFLHSYGGDAGSAYLMVKMLREIADEIHGYVPSRAKSAATLFMLGTNKIIMGPTSELGPVDPLVIYPVLGTWMPAKAVIKATEEILPRLRVSPEAPPLAVLPVDPAHIGLCHLAIEDAEKYTRLLIKEYNLRGKKDEEINNVIKFLVEGYPSHSFALSYDECKRIGLNVEKRNMIEWRDVWEIYTLIKNVAKGFINKLQRQMNIKDEEKLRKVMRKLSPLIIASMDGLKIYTQEAF